MADSSGKVLRVGLPSGSLQEPTFALFAKAGFIISGSSRSFKPAVDDPELLIRVLRAQEISRYVEHGYLDCGITGYDWIQENGSMFMKWGNFFLARSPGSRHAGFLRWLKTLQ